jgi:hypothetical protein
MLRASCVHEGSVPENSHPRQDQFAKKEGERREHWTRNALEKSEENERERAAGDPLAVQAERSGRNSAEWLSG